MDSDGPPDSEQWHETDEDVEQELDSPTPPRQLPADLPTSLDDRRTPATLSPGVEVYDAWQGKLAYR